MPVNFEAAIKDSIMGPFRDMRLMLILIVRAIILFIISFLFLSQFFNLFSASSLLGTGASFFKSLAALLATSVVAIIIYALLSVFFTNAIISKSYYGPKGALNASLNVAINRYLSALGASILVGLVIVIPIFVAGAAFALSGLAGLLILILAIIFVVYVGLKFIVAVPFAVVGKKGPADSMRASWTATKDTWWVVFGVVLVLAIITLIINFIVGLPSSLILQSGIRSQLPIYNSSGGSANGSLNSTSQRLGQIAKIFRSPPYIAALFIASLIEGITNAWLIIVTVVLYSQLASGTKKIGQTGKAGNAATG